jgi:hypothetical protein
MWQAYAFAACTTARAAASADLTPVTRHRLERAPLTAGVPVLIALRASQGGSSERGGCVRKARLVVIAVMLAVGLAGATATAAAPIPHVVKAAVDKWTKTALQIQDSKIALALGQIGTASANAKAACDQPQTRSVVANIFTTIGSLLEGYVRNTERGELGLYKLAPQLGSKKNARRRAYVKQLDAVGTQLDFELRDVKDIQRDADRVDSSDCAAGLVDLDTQTSFLSSDHKKTDKELSTLHTEFG